MKKMFFNICIIFASFSLSACSGLTSEVTKRDFACGKKVVRLEIKPGSDEKAMNDFFNDINKYCPVLKKEEIHTIPGSVTPRCFTNGRGGSTCYAHTSPPTTRRRVVFILTNKPDEIAYVKILRSMTTTPYLDEIEFANESSLNIFKRQPLIQTRESSKSLRFFVRNNTK